MRTRRRGVGRRAPEAVPTITSARRALQEDVNRRTHRYLLSMAIRTACLVLAVLVEGPLRWVLLAAAILLPYVAVVFANAGREPEREADALLPPEEDGRMITAFPEWQDGPPTQGDELPERGDDDRRG